MPLLYIPDRSSLQLSSSFKTLASVRLRRRPPLRPPYACQPQRRCLGPAQHPRPRASTSCTRPTFSPKATLASPAVRARSAARERRPCARRASYFWLRRARSSEDLTGVVGCRCIKHWKHEGKDVSLCTCEWSTKKGRGTRASRTMSGSSSGSSVSVNDSSCESQSVFLDASESKADLVSDQPTTLTMLPPHPRLRRPPSRRRPRGRPPRSPTTSAPPRTPSF